MSYEWLRTIFGKEVRELRPTPFIEEERIGRLPTSTARLEALRQLRDPSQFAVTIPARHALPSSIPPDVRDIFSIGSNIQSAHGDLWFDDPYLSEPRHHPHIKIGTDIEHTEVWIDAETGEAICAEQIDNCWDTSERYPSIWHYVLIHCAQVYDYRWRSTT